jgi:hypothetical protein
MLTIDDDLDRPIRGARKIARVLNLLDDNGEPDPRKAFYALEKGYADADKFGKIWVSTKRRLLGPLVSRRAAEPSTAGETAEHAGEDAA